jgi:hypothetical protein
MERLNAEERSALWRIFGMADARLARIGLICLTSVAFLVPARAMAQEGPLRDEQPPVPVGEIVTRFAEKEAEFAAARNNYVFRQDVQVQELDARDRAIGEFRMVSEIGFEPDGIRRTEEIVYAPLPTLVNITISQQDLQDIREIQPFVLTTGRLPLYDVEYVGKQQIDEIDNYVFDVGPREIEEGQRYFEGRIWVDDMDFQIVKTFGKAVPDIQGRGVRPEEENLFPRFETYRQPIDGYWFPTYTRAVDTLNFSSGPVRIRQVIRYEEYRRFGVDVEFSVQGGQSEPNPPAEPGETPEPED